MRRQIFSFLLLCSIAVAPYAHGQSFSADEGTRLRPVSEKVATALLSEINSIQRLTAEGQLLHENTKFQKSWDNYCSSAIGLNEEGEFRRAVRAASMALFLGEQSGNTRAMAYSKRDLAVSFSYTGNLDLAERFARESLQHRLDAQGYAEVGMVSRKTLGDVAMRRNQYDRAIAEYETVIQLSSSSFAARNSSSWKSLAQSSLVNALIAKGDLVKARAILQDLGEPSSTSIGGQVQRARANLALKDGRLDEALKIFRVLGEDTGSDAAYHKVWAKEGEARALLAAGNKPGAIEALLSAVALSEEIRSRFRSEEFRAGMFGQLQEVFEHAVALLVDAGQAEKAFEVAEAGRARALLDQIRGRVRVEQGAVFAPTTSGKNVLSGLRAKLAPGEIVIAYLTTQANSYAWLVEPGSLRVITLPVGRDALRAQIRQLRAHLSDQSPVALELLKQLHATLIAPLGPMNAKAIVFIPHDALHHLPFHALRDDGGYLIERAEISYAPSAATLVHLLERRNQSQPQRLFAIGNPDLGNPKLSLPGAEREVKQLQSLFPDSQVLIQREATKPSFFKQAPQYSLVHVAAHADFDDLDPLYSRIRLASTDDSSGVIEAHEIYKLRLAGTTLMTISACESGLSRVTGGDEIWGFSRAFLTAGTPALLVSLWPVADESTEKLMTGFYRGIHDRSPRAALREAQLALMRTEAYSHPFFWSPFTLVGDWR
jgi:CHAT domain-containing protein